MQSTLLRSSYMSHLSHHPYDQNTQAKYGVRPKVRGKCLEQIPARLRAMSVELFARPLRDLFDRPKFSRPSGAVFVADGLVDLDEIWNEGAIDTLLRDGLRCEFDEGHEFGRDELSEEIQDAVSEADEAIYPTYDDKYRRLVTFVFDGGRPGGSWGADLDWMRPEANRVYVCVPQTDEIERPWCAAAALEPASPDLLRAFLIDFLETDGKAYGFEEHFLHNFPTEIWDRNNELVPRPMLRDALASFLALKQTDPTADWRGALRGEAKALFAERLPTTRTDGDRALLVDAYLDWNDEAQTRWARPRGDTPAPHGGSC